MFILRKSFTFEAAHHLPHHDGACRRPHGHSFRLIVEVQANALISNGPKRDMVVDYGDISAAVKPLLTEFLDHQDLNLTLGMESPTSEAIARWVWERLVDVPSLHANLTAITIEETATACCEYRP